MASTVTGLNLIDRIWDVVEREIWSMNEQLTNLICANTTHRDGPKSQRNVSLCRIHARKNCACSESMDGS